MDGERPELVLIHLPNGTNMRAEVGWIEHTNKSQSKEKFGTDAV
ncbi:MAG: hypothetical protein JWN14_3028, partial [Chthonomonadales bacterium]|nr:hypothetical protein [Chthonomonadales bacterium]